MKKKITFLIAAAVMLLTMFASPMRVWADVVTFTPGTNTGATSVTIGDITATMTTMNNASYYQIYANQSGTFSTSNGVITKIEFTCTASGTSKYGPGNASSTVGTYSYSGAVGTWTGSETSVTISSTVQVRMTSLEITYTPAGGGQTTYTVTYDCNGGTSGCPSNVTDITAGASITLAAAPTRTDYTFNGWSDGTTTYGAGDSYTVNGNATMTAQWQLDVDYLFYESFDDCNGTGGNDNQWSGSIANSTLNSDNDDWTFANGSGAYKCAKFGTTSKLGSAQTPAISHTGSATLTFKAAAWNGGSESTTLKLSSTSGTLSTSTVTLVKGEWTNYTIDIAGITTSTQITFEGSATSNSRFFLDEVMVVEATPSTDPSILASDVNITYDAVSGSIAYTINNEPTPVGTLTANTSDSWLNLGTVTSTTVPFTCSANEAAAARTATVTLTYTYGDSQTVTKDVTVTQAGNPDVVMTIAQARAQQTGSVTTKGIVTSCAGTTGYIQDAAAAICVYGSELTVGDEIKVSGTLSTYKGLLEITSPTVTVISQGNTVDPTVMTIAEINESTNQGWYVRIENATVTGINDKNVTIAQEDNSIVVRFNSTDIPCAVNDIVSLDGNIGCFDAVQIANPQNVEVQQPTVPTITLEKRNTSSYAVTAYQFAFPHESAGGYLDNVICTNFTPESFNIYYFDETGAPADQPELIANAVVEWHDNNWCLYIASALNEGEARTAYLKVGAPYETGVVYSDLVTVNQAAAPSVAELPFAFDGGRADVATTDGLSQENLGTDYNSSPKLKFEKGNKDNDGLYSTLVLQFNERPGTLTFDIKGNSFSGSTFKVQTSEDGTVYTDLETYTELGNKQSETFDNLGENVRYIKWIYTQKVEGNVALGNIALTEYVEPVVTPSITVTPNEINATAEGGDGSLEITYENIPDLITFDLAFCDATGGEISVDPDWIDAEIQEENDNYSVYYVIGANNGEARTAYFKVYTYTGSELDEVSAIVTVNQEAGSTPPTPTPGQWVLTNLSDLTASDIFVIVGNNGDTYAMSNDNGTTSAPSAVAVTIANNALSANPNDNLKWNISSTDNGYIFYPNGSTETWLYCFNDNNGVRVGTGDAKHFNLSNDGYLTTTETTDQRYIGIYNSQDWRSYKNTTVNIANQTFAFYKYVADPSAPSITINPPALNDIPACGDGGFLPVTCANMDNPQLHLIFCDADGDETTYDWLTGYLTVIDNTTGVMGTILPNTGSQRIGYMKVCADSPYDICSNIVSFTQLGYEAPTVASLPFNFTGGKDQIAATDGIVESGLGGDFGDNPKLKFKIVNSYVIVHFDENPGTLTFDVRGDGEQWSGEFKVQTSTDGENYTDLETYDNLTTTVQSEEFDLDENIRYIRWIYTDQVGENRVALGNINVTAEGGGTTSGWVLTPLADLTASDVFVIVGNNGSTYALPSAVTSSAPAAVAITVNGNALAANPADNLKWNISSTDNGYIFYTNGTTESWLYCINNNNGVRVGTGDAKHFNLSNDGYLTTTETTDQRYLGIYNSQDWRCYTSTGVNIANQTFAFYKYVADPSAPSINAEDVNIAWDATGGEIEYTINNPVESGQLEAVPTHGGDRFTIGQIGETTIAFSCPVNTEAQEQYAIVELRYHYDNKTITKEVTITQAANPTFVNNISDITETGTDYAIVGTIVAKSARGLVFGDGTGYVYYYNQNYTQDDYNVGDIKKISGTMGSYNHVFQFTSSATIEAATYSNYNNTPEIQVLDANGILAYNNDLHLSDYVQIEGKLVKSGNFYNIQVNGLATDASIAYPTTTQAEGLNALENKTVIVKGYFAGVSSGHFNVVMESVVENTEPSITASNVNISWDATGGEIEYTINNPVESGNLQAIPQSGGDIFEIGQISETTIAFTCPVNTTANERTAVILLTYTYNRASVTTTVTITQAACVSEFATLPFDYMDEYVAEHGLNNMPSGLTQEGLGTYPNSTPRLKFDTEGDWLLLKLADTEEPNSVSYDIKGNSFSGGTFDVLVSQDGEDYEPLATYVDEIPTGTETYLDLGLGIHYIKWVYTSKDKGNVALGNIHVSANYDIYTNTTMGDLTLGNVPYIVHDGVTMTVTGTLNSSTYPNDLIIEDGGQFIYEGTNDFYATQQKDITSWNAKSVSGWYLIASPAADVDVSGLIGPDGTYDLFWYNEPTYQWCSHNGGVHPFNSLDRGWGYLYANQSDVILNFAGVMKPTNSQITVPLSHEGSLLTGFNLLGNPFTRELSTGDMKMGATEIETYYFSEGGDKLEVLEISEQPIKPGRGFMIQTSETDPENALVFNPTTKGNTSTHGYIKIMAGNDNAFIKIGGGNTLRKMNIANTTKVYVMNDDKDYAAARVEELAGTMPVHFKAAEDGEYTITIEAVNADVEYMHLIDNFTGNDIDLLLESSYTFNATTNDSEARFRLDFGTYGVNEIAENNTFAYQYGNNIVVNGEGELQIFDLMGRMIMNTKINGVQSVNVPSNSVYILKLNNNIQKIVVK